MFLFKTFKNKKYLKALISSAFVFIFVFLSWSLPAHAASDKLTFGLWDKYRNQIQIGYELGDGYGSLSYSNFFTYENDVSTNSELITTFKNTAPIQPDYSGKYNFVNNFSLSVPTTKLSPEFFISNAFLNKDITFTIMLTVKINNGEFWQSSFENNPYFAFYVGSIENYSQIPCTLKNDSLTVNPSSLTYKADLTVNFKSTGFICGFFFRFGNSGGVGVRLDGNYNYPYFYTEYTLSPLNFTEVTVEDVQNAVAGSIIDGTGGNNYNSFDNSTSDIFFDKESAINEISSNLLKDNSVDFSFTVLSLYPELVSTMRGLSAFVDDHVLRLPFLRVVLYMSLGLGCLGFLFGLAQFVSSRSNTYSSSGNKRSKGKKGD
ncbi:MAG: hypothetical protein E7365_00690 [Clostridiales bacterium]|nr:hypothetical protein [Clostridiales bacterium]